MRDSSVDFDACTTKQMNLACHDPVLGCPDLDPDPKAGFLPRPRGQLLFALPRPREVARLSRLRPRPVADSLLASLHYGHSCLLASTPREFLLIAFPEPVGTLTYLPLHACPDPYVVVGYSPAPTPALGAAKPLPADSFPDPVADCL